MTDTNLVGIRFLPGGAFPFFKFPIAKLSDKVIEADWLVVMSCFTVFAGLYPVLTKKSNNYILLHFTFMYWSVIGFYAAFMAEIFSRLPKITVSATCKPITIFYQFAGIGITIVLITGMFFLVKYNPGWTALYKRK